MEDRPGKIFVGGLDFDINEAEFEKYFAKFGKITEVLLKRDPQNGKSRGFGFITYENPSDADEAVKQLDKQDIKGKMVHVDHAVKPGGGPGGDRGGRGGFRGRGAPRGRGMGGSFRDSYNSSGRGGGSGFRGRGGDSYRGSRGSPRGDRGSRGGFSGRGRGMDRPMRGGYGDDRRGQSKGYMSPRRSSVERGYGDRGMGVRRDEDRYGNGVDRDRYGSSSMSDRRPRDNYPPSPPRAREPVSSYRDYSMSSREYSPPRDRTTSRDYMSSRDMAIPSRSSYETSRDTYTSSRDPYPSRRDEYVTSRDSRDFVTSRESSRDYMSSRETARPVSREYDRMPSRDNYDPYRERMSTGASRGYGGGSSPPRSRSPIAQSRSVYSPPRGMPIGRELDRERTRDYSPGARRPGAYDSRGAPPMKRSRPDDMPPRGMTQRDGPQRGMSRDMPSRDTHRGPPRGPPRDGGRGGPQTFRR